VDGDVESEKLNKTFVVTEAEEGREVVGVIFRRIDGWEFALAEDIAVDTTGNVGQFGNPARNIKQGSISQK
jgi:hypothetical protein